MTARSDRSAFVVRRSWPFACVRRPSRSADFAGRQRGPSRRKRRRRRRRLRGQLRELPRPADRAHAAEGRAEGPHADAIHLSLTSGTMAMQARHAQHRREEGGRRVPGGQDARRRSARRSAGLCAAKPAPLGNLGVEAAVERLGRRHVNSRYQPKPGMTAADVPNLKLKWAFGFPGGTQAYGNPSIVGGRVFVGSDNGTRLRARRRAPAASTGRSRRTAASAARRASAEPGARDAVSTSATSRRNVFALDAVTGEQIWKKKVDTHAFARVTGAPTLADGKLYVPVSSVEEVPAAQPKLRMLHLPRQRRRARRGDRRADLEELHRSGSAAAGRQERRRARRCGGRPARRCGASPTIDTRRACSTSAPATRTPARR